jgi:hypothetical protein
MDNRGQQRPSSSLDWRQRDDVVAVTKKPPEKPKGGEQTVVIPSKYAVSTIIALLSILCALAIAILVVASIHLERS